MGGDDDDDDDDVDDDDDDASIYYHVKIPLAFEITGYILHTPFHKTNSSILQKSIFIRNTLLQMYRRYMAEILMIRRKTLSNQTTFRCLKTLSKHNCILKSNSTV